MMRQNEYMRQNAFAETFQETSEIEKSVKTAIKLQRGQAPFEKSEQAIQEVGEFDRMGADDMDSDISFLEMKMVLDILSWETTEVGELEDGTKGDNHFLGMII